MSDITCSNSTSPHLGRLAYLTGGFLLTQQLFYRLIPSMQGPHQLLASVKHATLATGCLALIVEGVRQLVTPTPSQEQNEQTDGLKTQNETLNLSCTALQSQVEKLKTQIAALEGEKKEITQAYQTALNTTVIQDALEKEDAEELKLKMEILKLKSESQNAKIKELESKLTEEMETTSKQKITIKTMREELNKKIEEKAALHTKLSVRTKETRLALKKASPLAPPPSEPPPDANGDQTS
jgi:chaperonin cofactor prefoldin